MNGRNKGLPVNTYRLCTAYIGEEPVGEEQAVPPPVSATQVHHVARLGHEGRNNPTYYQRREDSTHTAQKQDCRGEPAGGKTREL